MAKYRRKPAIVNAVQWFEKGDHPAVKMIPLDRFEHLKGTDRRCNRCQLVLDGIHGEIEDNQQTIMVCPGDFIVTGLPGGMQVWQPDYFASIFERVKS